MAGSNQLERISSLVDRLGPIGTKQRGMRIEAEEWNALVDVLLGILQVDRAQEESTQGALEQRFAARSHEHLGQVDVAWLDAETQSRVGGQQSSVSARTVLAEIEQKLQGLGQEAGRLTALAETQQRVIDRSTVDAVDRGQTLSQFEDRFAGLENLRSLVTTVSADVNSVRDNVGVVLELRKSLSDAQGNPIDVAGMRTDVNDIKGLRENLKGVDGELLRLRDIEIKLKEVADAAGAGGEGGLDQRLADISAAMEGRLNARIAENGNALRDGLAAENSASEGRLHAELNVALDARAQTLDQTLDTKVAGSETRLRLSMDARIDQSADSIRQDANSTATALIESRLAGLSDQVRAVTGEMIAGLRTDLATALRDGLAADLEGRFAVLTSQVNSRVAAVEKTAATVQEQIPSLITAHMDEFRASLEETLDVNIGTRIEAARVSLQEGMTAQVKVAISAAVGDLNGRIDGVVAARLADLDTIVKKSVAAATRNLPEQISAEVKTQIAGLDLPGLVDRTGIELGRELRTEQAAALAAQQASSSTAINDSVVLLRGEIGAVRSELNNTIDTRIKQNNEVIRTQNVADINNLQDSIKPDAFRSGVVQPIRVQPIRPIR